MIARLVDAAGATVFEKVTEYCGKYFLYVGLNAKGNPEQRSFKLVGIKVGSPGVDDVAVFEECKPAVELCRRCFQPENHPDHITEEES